MGVSGGSSSSTPKDMTPQAFKGLQGPYAAVIGQLLGYNITNPNGTSTNPVSFTYPGGQFTGQGGTGAQTQAGQTARPGMNNTGNTGMTFRVPGGGSTGGTYMPAGNGGGSGGGAGGSGVPGTPGYTVTNPNLGTGNPNDILNGIPGYQGPLTAQLGANEQSILDMLMANSGQGSGSGTSGGIDAATGQFLQNQVNGNYLPGNYSPQDLAQFAQGVQGAYATPGYDPNSENPFLAAAIQAAQRPTLQGLTETLTRDLPGRFTQAGQFTQPQGSSAFDRAAAIATRGASDAMGDIATKLSYQTTSDQLNRAFQANQSARAAEDTSNQAQLARQNQNSQNAQDRQIQAAGLAPQVSKQQVDNMVSNLQAQALPRLIQEYGIERGMDEFNNRMNSLLSVLGIAGGVTQPTVSQSSKSSQAGVSLK